MTETTYACKHCPARFEGEDGAKQLKEHNDGFHPAGAPVERLLNTPAAAVAVGKDHGPAIQGVASDLADALSAITDLQERVKALEEGKRSETDLAVLAEQVAPRLGAGVVPVATPTEPESDDGPTYRDLQAKARTLEIPATGQFEKLQIAIAAEEQRLAEAALAARSGEGTQGGDSTPAGDPDASATGEAGTPPKQT